jgi:hypothetical protein
MTDLRTHESRQVQDTNNKASGNASIHPRRQRSWEVDVQRARALRGDALEELTDSQREWVWRSLLRGVRLAQATKLAHLPPKETPQALQQVANRYSTLMDQRRRKRLPQRDAHTKERDCGLDAPIESDRIGCSLRVQCLPTEGRARGAPDE